MNSQYAAGFFDGEGCIHITKGNKPRLLVEAGQVSRPVIDQFQAAFGGKVSESSQGSRRPQWRWKASGEEAVAFLKTVRPHLVVKEQQAEIALAFSATRTTFRGRAVPEEELALREGYRLALVAAKKQEHRDANASTD